MQEEAARRQVETLLSGEADANDTYVEVHSGAGGTESQDWAQMLMRMYIALGRAPEIQGRGARDDRRRRGRHQGRDAADQGPQRLWLAQDRVGRAPAGAHLAFDSNARRHTSFASVWVYPVVDDRINIEVKESDCRIDTFRSSGAGGQHVNTTDSAVRITHIPTGIVVACQQERSQHKNRATAWNMLRARLYELELKKREEKANAEAASKTEIGWGHQIRSYVLQPYQLVKDLRTGTQSTSPQDVLDGDLDAFMGPRWRSASTAAARRSRTSTRWRCCGPAHRRAPRDALRRRSSQSASGESASRARGGVSLSLDGRA